MSVIYAMLLTNAKEDQRSDVASFRIFGRPKYPWVVIYLGYIF